MIRYILTRVAATIPVLLGVTLITFVLAQVIPTDPASLLAGELADEETTQRIREQLGLEEPVLIQYGIYLKRVVRGDLGTSIYTRQPIAPDLMNHFMATMELAAVSMMFAVAIGVPAGVLAATHKGKLFDRGTRILALLGAATPVFWFALVLVAVVSLSLGWFPISGRYSIGLEQPASITGLLLVDSVMATRWDAFFDASHHIILPAFCLGFSIAATISRVTRSTMVEALREEYIVAAGAKGLPHIRLVWIHALRNAFLPTLAVIGLAFGALLSGAILTESVFAWPGLGRYALSAILRTDYPALMGVVLTMTVAYVLVTLTVDLLYGALNPRIRR